ncbi:MAG: TIGR00341 family protein [Chloroflexota bacterium]
MSEENDHQFKRILVPVANPDTAPALLKLALALASPQPESVLAIVVSTGDTEDEINTIQAVKLITAELNGDSEGIKLITRVSTSVIRGILDAAREENADLIIVGASRRQQGEFVLGPIVENVAATAPCNILIYRVGTDPDFERIVIPADGNQSSMVAAQIGQILANYFAKPIEVVYVKRARETYWEGRARLERTLEGVPDRQFIKRNVVAAQVPVSGILSRIDSSVLLVIGISERSTFEKWLFGDFIQQLLNRSPGPVLLIAFPSPKEKRVRKWTNIRIHAPSLTPLEQEEMAWYAERAGFASLDYLLLVVISAILATLGLLLNSNAVIIGAMLVAPLMQPLIALAIGLTTGRIAMILRGASTLILGIMVALLVAVALRFIMPFTDLTPEILARGSPTLLDVLVAMASGFIGAYATSRKDIPSALAGVAIAAALMPPLCVVGLGIASGRFYLAFGAAMLFVANILCITFSACMVFLWLGMRQIQIEGPKQQKLLVTGVWVALIVLVAGVVFVLTLRTNQTRIIDTQLHKAFPLAEIVSIENIPQNPIQLIVTLRSAHNIVQSEVNMAQQALRDTLNQDIHLEITVWPMLQGS